jgi:hypothetical protein
MVPWPFAWFLALSGTALWVRAAAAPPGAVPRLLLDACIFLAFLGVVVFSYLRTGERRQALRLVGTIVDRIKAR